MVTSVREAQRSARVMIASTISTHLEAQAVYFVFAVTSSGLLSRCTLWQKQMETRSLKGDYFNLISRNGYISKKNGAKH